MKNKICAIIFLIFYCLASLAIIAYDLKESLTKDEEILYNINEEKPIPKYAEEECCYTVQVVAADIKDINASIEAMNKEKKSTTSKKRKTVKKQEVVVTDEIIVSDTDTSNLKLIGRCRLTVYTPNETHWGYTTATGVRSAHLATCAVDPRIIPYGSTVVLSANGNEWRLKAVDCGNFRGKMIDVFYDGSVSDGVSWLISMFGAEYANVYIEV